MNVIKNYAGLEYVVIKTKNESLSAKALVDIERSLSIEIIQNRPLRGSEILFLRKQLGLSCSKLSTLMEGALDPSTISKWEQKKDVRLSPVNETFMRIFFAEKLGHSMKASREVLVPNPKDEIFELAA